MPAARETDSNLLTTSAPPALTDAQLPSSKDADLVLDVATDLESEQTWRLNANEWKGFLSLDEYLQREKVLYSADLTRDGNATIFILTSTKLPRNEDGSRPILAACETLLKYAYVVKNNEMRTVATHGIGSVFCRPEHRGKGYAGRMIAELGKKLETWQQPKASRWTFSVLYSDIGPNFYAKYGWKAFPSTHIMLRPIDTPTYVSLASSWPKVRDLTAEDLYNIPGNAYLEQEMKQLSKNHLDTAYVAFKLDKTVLEWHFMREEFLAETLGKTTPSVKGAIHELTGVVMSWTRVYGADSKHWHLRILNVIVPPAVAAQEVQKALSALMLRAQHEAFQWDMSAGVELWSPSETALAAARSLQKTESDKIELVSRDEEHICSLRWNGCGSEKVEWVANEGYAWN